MIRGTARNKSLRHIASSRPTDMPINVTCPSCHTRFTVAEKYAGQKGPCPKCKSPITIPKLEDQVVIHAPEHSEAGSVGAGGRHVLKTFKRQDTKFQPLMFAVVAVAVLSTLLVALVLRGTAEGQNWLTLAIGAILLGPPLAWGGYTFLRDPELEAYSGLALAIRSVGCGLVFALCWGIYVFIGREWFGEDALAKGLEIWQMV
ncbi:MAG TPA: hypothetical protein VGI75_05120, partial [Pirellulales bacterium]